MNVLWSVGQVDFQCLLECCALFRFGIESFR